MGVKDALSGRGAGRGMTGTVRREWAIKVGVTVRDSDGREFYRLTRGQPAVLQYILLTVVTRKPLGQMTRKLAMIE
jgi:hypothetical protein